MSRECNNKEYARQMRNQCPAIGGVLTVSEELWLQIADRIERSILPRCDVGDTLYFVLEDDIPEHRFYISEERVAEVCSKGFFISACFPAQDDLGEYFSWDDIGKDIFLTREEAEAMLEEKEGGIEDEKRADQHQTEIL